MDTIDITFQYTQEEFIKAERKYLLASKTITIPGLVFLGVLVPFSVFYVFFSRFNILSIVTCLAAILAAIAGFYLYLYSPVLKYKQTLKYQEEYHLAFSQDGIAFKTPTIDSELQWDIYCEAWESSEFFFLIQGPRVYSLIPKHTFQDAGALQAFRELVAARIAAIKSI